MGQSNGLMGTRNACGAGMGLSVRLPLTAMAFALSLTAPMAAQAQTASGSSSDAGSLDASSDASMGSGNRNERTKRLQVRPYIELNQIVTAELSGGNDILTYSQIAAGVDANYIGQNSGLSASVRYERQFGWGKRAGDGDEISGLVNGYITVAPGVTLQAGGLATQVSTNSGVAALGPAQFSDNVRSTIYSVYAGPSVTRKIGDLDVSAAYRAGFTKVDTTTKYRNDDTGRWVDQFDQSVSHTANVAASFAPGTVLPVGIGASSSFFQEDISNLDQRVRNFDARALVTVPVSRTVQVVGALGYEDVEVGHRNAVIGSDGIPVIDSKGQYVIDTSKPRQLAYDVSGLVWDVAVMWRPSRRTSLSAHIGRRYGSLSFGGTLSYAPNDRSNLSVQVYDNMSGFGGQLNNTLIQLPDDYEVVRDPITGELRGCVVSLAGSNCLNSALGSVRSGVFRSRGVSASYSHQIGRLNAGIGLGYDRRNYIAAQDTVLAQANGVVDESYWILAYLEGKLGSDAGWSTSAYASLMQSTDPYYSGNNAYTLAASYYHLITPRLRGTVALAVNGLTNDKPQIDDLWTASALAGLRYSF